MFQRKSTRIPIKFQPNSDVSILRKFLDKDIFDSDILQIKKILWFIIKSLEYRKNMTEDILSKQKYLRSTVLEKNYNTDVFIDFLESKKKGGSNIESWNLDELKTVWFIVDKIGK